MNVENFQIIKIYNDVIDSDTFEVCKKIKTILDKIQQLSNIDAEQMFDIQIILSELLQNAIQHGNDCDKDKKIHVHVWLHESSDVLGITVMDQGCGFNTFQFTDLELNRIFECNPSNISESGRGLFIVQSLCDCMEFNSSGNSITVKKKLYYL